MWKERYLMGIHCMLKKRKLVFYTFFLPLLLAAAFHFIFADRGYDPEQTTIPIAIIASQESSILELEMKAARFSSGKAIFSVSVCENREEAWKLLQENEVIGCVSQGGREVVVKKSGMEEIVLKQYLEQYQYRQMEAENPVNYVKEQTNTTDAGQVVPYYALMALACMLGSLWGADFVKDLEADQSERAVRLNLAPVPKVFLIIQSISQAFLVHMLELSLLLLFIMEVLKIDFGSRIPISFLVIALGSITAIGGGALAGLLLKGGMKVKRILLIAFSGIGSLLAGLVPGIKYFMDLKLPFIARWNPAGLITDSLLRLFYYDNPGRLLLQILTLAFLAFFFQVLAGILLRRKQYAGF